MSVLRLILLVLLAFALPAHAAEKADKAEKAEKGEKKPDKKEKSSKMDYAPKALLPVSKYLTILPFVVPLTRGNEVTGQYSLVVALELSDPDVREELGRQLPRLRNEMYSFLFQAVTARSSSGQVPRLDYLQDRVLRIARETTGPDMVTGVAIQEAYAGPLPFRPDPQLLER